MILVLTYCRGNGPLVWGKGCIVVRSNVRVVLVGYLVFRGEEGERKREEGEGRVRIQV